jgi:hypothetical protein
VSADVTWCQRNHEDLAQGDVRRHMRRRIISQGEQRQERGAICS